MLNLTEQKATLAELELLVAVRCRVLRAANQLPEVESQTRTYYQKPLPRTPTRRISFGTVKRWQHRRRELFSGHAHRP